MQTYIHRSLQEQVEEYMKLFPVVALLGPRQCGKSTLAGEMGKNAKDFLYIDLESPADRMRLNDLTLFFGINRSMTVCIDEAQLMPHIFPELRSIVDKDRRNGKILLLGSASRDLVNQSAESLAGRIGYLELSPFTFSEIDNGSQENLINHWLRGGFPQSYLAENTKNSNIWRKQYLQTYLERDLITAGNSVSLLVIQRLLQMLANNNGQLFNSSQIANSLGISYHTVRNYVDFFEKSFLTRSLQPYLPNLNKRLNKSPKVYFRDSGLLHTLLDVTDMNHLLGLQAYGFSWESYVIENIVSHAPDWQPWFYRTSTGNEIDLVLTRGNKKIAIEIKSSLAPILSKGTYQSLNDLDISELIVVSLVEKSYHFKPEIWICNLRDVLEYLKSIS
jgi:predicted AAA+ superfamily ATPase